MHEDVEPVPIRIAGPPEPVSYATGRDDNFIQMPLAVWPRAGASNAACEMPPEAVDPEPNGLPADDNAAFREQTFNIPGTWGKPMVCPNRAGDDFARKAETFEAGEKGRDLNPDKIPDAEPSTYNQSMRRK